MLLRVPASYVLMMELWWLAEDVEVKRVPELREESARTELLGMIVRVSMKVASAGFFTAVD